MNPLKKTASSAGPPAPARGRCYPRASPPPQHTHRLQESEATGAISPSFPMSAALAHQHHAQPRAAARFFAKSARALIERGGECIMHRSNRLFSVGVRTAQPVLEFPTIRYSWSGIYVKFIYPIRTYSKPPQNRFIYPVPIVVRIWHLTVHVQY